MLRVINVSINTEGEYIMFQLRSFLTWLQAGMSPIGYFFRFQIESYKVCSVTSRKR